MRILGVDLRRDPPASGAADSTVVRLDDSGRVSAVERAAGVPAVAAAVAQLVGDEPFLLGVDVPVVVPAKNARTRQVESLLRRRLGVRLPPGGRASTQRLAGEALLAGLASAGLPCLPFPDRDRRRSGLAETHPELIAKALLWETSSLTSLDAPAGEEVLRALALPPYRTARMSARRHWSDQAAALELALRVLGATDGFDLRPAREELQKASSPMETERAGSLLDAALIAGTARRYLEAAESSMFVGDLEQGYVILPADGRIRRLLLGQGRPRHADLFPRASIADRLGPEARLQPLGLLPLPGQPTRTEASFARDPRYEFDNVDEMLWWKHCRHLSGPALPVEGLMEMLVVLERSSGPTHEAPLRLVRSRHRTISFRFEPPSSWRARVPTRDGKTYTFRVSRAVYETLGGRE